MKRCHFKSEHSTAGALCTANEALEAIIDDSAEVMSAARAVTSHKGLVGKAIGMLEPLGAGNCSVAEAGEVGTLGTLPCSPTSPDTGAPLPPLSGLFKVNLVGAKWLPGHDCTVLLRAFLMGTVLRAQFSSSHALAHRAK